MSKQYWLSYSGFDTYRKCPKKYYLTRILKEKPPFEDSRHNALIGTVVQRVFEDFYNMEVWRAGKGTSQRLEDLAHTYFYQFLKENYVNWSDPSCRMTQEECLQTCRDMVSKTLDAIKREKLLGPYSKSEVVQKVQLQNNFFLYGIIDFLIRKQDGTIILLDGKASKHREKYVDRDQLVFYGLAFHLQHMQMPHKLGFIFYHFGDDPEQAFEWMDIQKKDIDILYNQVLETFLAIRRKQFKATPMAKHCQYCPWEPVCEERQKQKQQNRETRRANRIARGEPHLPSEEEMGDSAFIGFGFVEK